MWGELLDVSTCPLSLGYVVLRSELKNTQLSHGLKCGDILESATSRTHATVVVQNAQTRPPERILGPFRTPLPQGLGTGAIELTGEREVTYYCCFALVIDIRQGRQQSLSGEALETQTQSPIHFESRFVSM